MAENKTTANKPAPAGSTAKPKMVFTIGDIAATGVATIVPPKTAKRSGNSGVFPYDKLEVNGFFPIKGRDAESMSSTISSANKRFRQFDASFEIEVPGPTDPNTGLPTIVKKRMCKRFDAFAKKDVPGAEAIDADVLVFRMPNIEWRPEPVKAAKPATPPAA